MIKRRLNSLLSTTLISGACILLNSPAIAATSTGNLTVTATVVASCTISGGALAFGNYSLAVIDASTTFTATCTSGTPYNIGLDAGTGAGATTTTRKMTSGSNTLDYTLWQDPGRSINWGNVVATDTFSGTGNGTAQTINVYGRIPANQASQIGSYADTVTITINF